MDLPVFFLSSGLGIELEISHSPYETGLDFDDVRSSGPERSVTMTNSKVTL